MVIDNQALIKLVDVIGGVEFYVPEDMYYKDPSQNLVINLKEGLQVLNGDKAEQLVRFRKNSDNTTYSAEYGKDDNGRMRTQREFIIETVKQTIQAKNVFKIRDIIDIAYEYVKTNISISTIKDYVPYAINVDIDGIQSAVLPGKSVGPNDGASLWYYLADEKKAEELMKELYFSEDVDDGQDGSQSDDSTNNSSTDNNPDTSISASDDSAPDITKKEAAKIKIEILNGSGSDKILSEVKKKLTAQGYSISRTKATTSTSKTTIINKTDVDAKFEKNIKELLGVGNISSSTVSSSNVDITIIIGKDYNK